MKLTIVLLFLAGCFACTHANAQTVTLNMQNVPLQKVFKEISRQTGVSMIYKESMFKGTTPVTINVTDAPVNDVLTQCLQGQPLTFTMNGNTITIAVKKEKNTAPAAAEFGDIKGVITTTSDVMEGTTVTLKGKLQFSQPTNSAGQFHFSNMPYGKYHLIMTRVGFAKFDTSINLKQPLVFVNTTLKTEINTEKEVVVNGIYSRPKENFTGAATSFTGEQLREISTTNVITALRTLDASFQAPDDNTNGSDPNKIPRVQVRGTNSITNSDLTDEYGYISNWPLIIIDRIESSKETFLNLDINRIAKITILKDAAATAIYGSKSANGVLVVETRRPLPGKMDITYTAGLTLNVPDLSSFKLMNAAEKFEFEKIAGKYKSYDYTTQQLLNDRYNLVLHNIQRGVNTYWISQPIQNEFNQTHSLNINSGSEHFLYQANLFYGHNGGIMKGSKRNNLQATLSAGYANRKFRFNTQFIIGSTRGDNSPYGSFSQYSRLNQYWVPRDSGGRISKYVDMYDAGNVNGIPGSLPGNYVPTEINPLYNTTLHTLDYNKTFSIAQNLVAEWTLVDKLKINGTFSYASSSTETNYFLPGSASEFFNVAAFDERGVYNKTYLKDFNYQGSVNLDYGKIFGLHTIYATLGTKLDETTNRSEVISVKGFANDRLDDLLFGLQYSGEKPYGGYNRVRNIGFYGNASYAFDNRYLLDASWRTDGSSVFGDNKRFGQLWAVGAGWNLHKERFFHLPSVINRFKLRGSYGYTGSVDFPGYAGITTYGYITRGRYLDFIPAVIKAFGNPDLVWQRTKKYNIGADISLWNDRLSLTVNYYLENTDNVIMQNESAPSTGFNSYSNNQGKSQNRGYEISVSALVLKNPAKKLYWNISTSWYHNENKLIQIADVLKKQNEEAIARQNLGADDPRKITKPVLQFKEGHSLSELYAVRSLGIDPGTGREIFLTKDGRQTFNWNSDDQVSMGDIQPKFNITLTNQFQYKWIKLNFGLNVQLGGVQYNTTLADRYENADINYNADRRALEGRWQQPGDIAQYTGLTDIYGYPLTKKVVTTATSRFVKKNNLIQLTGLTLDPGALLSKYITRYTNLLVNKLNNKAKDVIKTDMIDVKFVMNNVFTFASQDKERGISYPFSRTFTLNITLRL